MIDLKIARTKRRKLLRDKRGSIIDVLFVGVTLLFFGMVLLLGFKMAGEFNSHIQGNSDMPALSKSTASQLTSYYPGVINNMFLFLTIGLAVVTLILAAMVRVHPVFIPIFLIALVLVIIMSAMLSNIYDGMASDPTLSSQADQLSFVSLILGKLPFIVGIIGVLLMVIMYKTWRVNV